MALTHPVDVSAADPASKAMTLADVETFTAEARAAGADGTERVFVGVSKTGRLTALFARPGRQVHDGNPGRHRRRETDA